IPDFVLEYDMPEARHVITIECQDRQRSQKDIANKIRTMKSLSPRNRFLFVHGDQLPKATGKALEADGTPYVSYEEFVDFIADLSDSIKHTDRLVRAAARAAAAGRPPKRMMVSGARMIVSGARKAARRIDDVRSRRLEEMWLEMWHERRMWLE